MATKPVPNPRPNPVPHERPHMTQEQAQAKYDAFKHDHANLEHFGVFSLIKAIYQQLSHSTLTG